MKQFNKFFTFMGLYIAQAIPMSFFTTVVPVIMRQENYSLESIGLLQFVKLPWILKFLWAPLVDKKTGTLQQYKKWIIGSEIFYAIVILSIGFFNLQTNFNLIVILVIMAVIASATQDIATDALAILTLKKDQRGMGNAIQSSGGFLGALIGSGVLLLIYNSFGWQTLLFGLAIFVLIALFPLTRFQYPLIKENSKTNISGTGFKAYFKQKGILPHILFLFFSYSGVSGMMGMLKPYLVDVGYKLNEIGYISGILGTLCAAVAAFIAGYAIKKNGVKKPLIVFIVLNILTALYFYGSNMHFETGTHIVVGVCLLWIVYGLLNVSVFMLAMDWTRSGREGTDFTVQIVIAQLGSLVIAGCSGFIARQINYNGLFIAEGVLSLLLLAYILSIYKKQL